MQIYLKIVTLPLLRCPSVQVPGHPGTRFLCDVLIRFVVVWNYRGHSPSPHLPASQVSTMFVRFVSHVQLARVSIGDTFFLQRRGFLETIMASHRFYELLHPQNVTHIMNNKDHKVAPCLQKIQPFS